MLSEGHTCVFEMSWKTQQCEAMTSKAMLRLLNAVKCQMQIMLTMSTNIKYQMPNMSHTKWQKCENEKHATCYMANVKQFQTCQMPHVQKM